MTKRLNFTNDYLQAMHPAIMETLVQTNTLETGGYGNDPFTQSAQERIRQACQAPQANVRFLMGGTQANQIMIKAFLQSYQGVMAAQSGHISVHEAGAIEMTGHKVIEVPSTDGKISAETVKDCLETYWNDGNHEHMVMPGMVYISQPTELGTLYSKAELEALSQVCRDYQIPLYVDGARLAYALACPENDVPLPDLAQLCDAFYIGGTKCGAMFGEAVVIPNPHRIPHFTSIIKQHGALLAKGRLLGIQFDRLFENDLYQTIGQDSIRFADQIRQSCHKAGLRLAIDSPTNQVFCIVNEEEKAKLAEQVDFSFWEKYDDHHTVIRIATAWYTQKEDVEQLCHIIESLKA